MSKYILEKNKNSFYSDGSVLLSLYIALVQGVLDSISVVSKDYKNLHKEFLNASVFNKIKQVADVIYGEEVLKQNSIEIEL